MKLKENGDTKNYFSTKDIEKSLSVTKTQNNSRFSNSKTHTYKKQLIIIIQKVQCNYRKVKQRMSSHLNTNSHSFNSVKYKNTNFGDVFSKSIFKRKLMVIKAVEN